MTSWDVKVLLGCAAVRLCHPLSQEEAAEEGGGTALCCDVMKRCVQQH